MTYHNQADRIDLFDFRTAPMRAFHCAWIAFFLCFFAWFGLAPLMPIIRAEMQLQPWQIGNLIVASVSATILARLIVGPLCDWFGPRLTYTWLLVLASLLPTLKAPIVSAPEFNGTPIQAYTPCTDGVIFLARHSRK